ncbi:PEP-CTERM sorting domain-containing protein [Sphingomonas montanisoli]|uniref:PEP-CTERM sorting domain-containing protein n=2 Tax=Sphingomonas montanisoli TaxID=2606412 RepID=A0A5D9C497_9SPHN|nr:PEP-CTERM sorting domain-containing protein [Sphingomonas montanisoli]
MAVPIPASASTFLSFNGSTGVFGNDLTDSPMFSDTIDLGALPVGWMISATISSTYQDGLQGEQDIDFTGVTLNGQAFDIGSSGQNEFRFINNAVAQGTTNLFQISGTSGTNSSYSGTINVAPVPEPATWMMLICGFGMIAMALRRSWRKAGEVLQAV